MKRIRFQNFKIHCFLLFIIWTPLCIFGQIKPIKEFQYSDENCYSRSIKIFKNHAILGNSNGKIYSVNLKNNKIKCLTIDLKLGEIRDIEISKKNIFGLQSADSGAVVIVDLKSNVKIQKGETLNWSNKFLDGMAINKKIGFIMGDPVGDKFSLYYSKDGGQNWFALTSVLPSFSGEAGFAASGTNVQIIDSILFFVSGGLKTRFFKSVDFGTSWKSTELPYPSLNSCGAYSLCMINESNGVVVGGDYTRPNQNNQISFYTYDGGENWLTSEIQPLGYRSCVTYENDFLFCCGTNGIDYSVDLGKTWIPFCQGNYFSMTTCKGKLFATTTNGTFHIFELPKK